MERRVQYQDRAWAPSGRVISTTPLDWMLEQPVVLIKQFNAAEQQFQAFEPRNQVPTAPTPQGWMLEQPVILVKQFNASEQQFDTSHPIGNVPTPVTPQGWMLEQPIVLIRGYNSSEQQFQAFNPLGLIAQPPTPKGWMLEQPVILFKKYDSSQQQFQTFEPKGNIATVTQQGWMQQQPTTEIFIRPFNTALQQFSIYGAPLLDINVVGVFLDDPDLLSGSVFAAKSNIQEVNENPDRMQILGYSNTETLLYDEPETEQFYLLRKPPLVTKNTLYKVTPSFAREWLLVPTGDPITFVYNPFGSNLTKPLSDDL